MENICKFLRHSLSQTIPVLSLIFIFSNNVFGACYGEGQRGGGMLCSPQVCSWERSDKRCNDSSECCIGKRCSSFGYCELCC